MAISGGEDDTEPSPNLHQSLAKYMNYMNLLVVRSYNLVKTFYLELNTSSCPNRQKMDTNTAFTFAYLLMALFNKQIPIAIAMLNR